MPTWTPPVTLTANTNENVNDLNSIINSLQAVVNLLDDANLSATAAIQASKLASGATGLAQGAFSASRSTTPATSVGPTAIVFDTEEYDVSGWYDNTTGRFTPQVPGIYRLGAAALFNAIAGASQALDIFKNGTVAKRLGSDGFVSSIGFAFNGSADVQANGTTDFFDVRWTGSTANAPLGGAHLTYFQGELVGRT